MTKKNRKGEEVFNEGENPGNKTGSHQAPFRNLVLRMRTNSNKQLGIKCGCISTGVEGPKTMSVSRSGAGLLQRLNQEEAVHWEAKGEETNTTGCEQGIDSFAYGTCESRVESQIRA